MLPRTHILFHHSAIAGLEPQYDRVRDYHNRGGLDKNGKKKWPAGYGCQYAFFLEKNGEIIEANPPERVTWHSGSWLWNARSIAIALAGSLLTEQVTTEQLRALVALTNALQARFSIPDGNLLDHRDVRNTSCPGARIKEMVLREKANHFSSKIDHLRKVIDRTEPPRKTRLQRALARFLALVPL